MPEKLAVPPQTVGSQLLALKTVRKNSLHVLPPPPEPPFYIDTFEPIHPPWQAIRGWIPADEAEAGTGTPELWDQSTATGWKASEIDLGDGRTLVLEST